MREVLFRGKRFIGDWVYGDLFYAEIANKRTMLLDKVIPETVGQYTGLTDKNGVQIFEGDIIKVYDDILGSPFCDEVIGSVEYDECAFFVRPINDSKYPLYLYDECAIYEVIGNVYDDLERLKREGETK